jgi:hypothetical protein
MDAQDIRSLQEAYMEVVENQQLDEAEGSYGQTPKASAAYTALAFGKGKSKTKSLALKHLIRSAGDDNSDKPSPKRSKMTQSDRDYHRGQSENGGEDREGIDFDEFDTGASGPGGKPKGKKLERQIKRGVSAESFDLYDIILSHLLDEGYAETPEAAEAIMVNMSEDWRESICEGYKKFPYKKVEDKIHEKEADSPTGRGTPQSVKMDKVFRHFKGEVRRTERREHSPKISKAKEAENRARGTQKG